MDTVNILRRVGLFDAKVPRYTSYPPANRFASGIGARHQSEWLGQVRPDQPVSLYVHIPFCRRLCWFCACRTQGTRTLSPVERYLKALSCEIDRIVGDHLAPGVQMKRLHLGGGTPTLLSPEMMTRLLDHIHDRFAPADGFEFSVEIDPTEAAPEVLDVLSGRNMTRASIGVQDFDATVQKAIGRIQSYEATRDVVSALRQGGVRSLNIDFLYGLPFQTAGSLVETLDRVVSLRPDRLALYGYAHVPHVSKRQVMIPEDALPSAERRYEMSQIAKERLVALGYEALGIDHFALPHDGLTQAAHNGRMSRNFQGYTDDPCEVLLGFGASAISRFPQGYLQNVVSTSAYVQRANIGGTAALKGIVLNSDDRFIATLIDAIMCHCEIRFDTVYKMFPDRMDELFRLVDDLMFSFPGILACNSEALVLPQRLAALSRLIAAHLDRTRCTADVHSLAV